MEEKKGDHNMVKEFTQIIIMVKNKKEWLNIQIYGRTTLLKVDGTVDIAIGDYIATFTTGGIGQKCTTAGKRYLAKALEVYTSDDSNGVINAWIEKGNLSS